MCIRDSNSYICEAIQLSTIESGGPARRWFIILDMSLAYGLTTRPHANTIIDTVTYLVDGTYRRWFWGCSEPPRAGTASSRGTLGPVIHYTCPYPTDGGVGPASGGLQGARRLATGSYSGIPEYGGEGVNYPRWAPNLAGHSQGR